jgi:hypothetical protein
VKEGHDVVKGGQMKAAVDGERKGVERPVGDGDRGWSGMGFEMARERDGLGMGGG